MDVSVYKRPNKPKCLTVKKRSRDFALSGLEKPDLLEVDRRTECHVTPQPIAGRMADYLNLSDGISLLEPQCGTGNLIAAVIDTGYQVQITAVERFVTLYQSARARFKSEPIEFSNECFLEFAAVQHRCYDRIIMNPPFRETKKHVEAAYSLLKEGGILIALVPVTFQHSNAYEIERLDQGTFLAAKVHTKLIELIK